MSARARLSLACMLSLACGSSDAKELTTEQLSAVVDAQREGLQACYQAALERTPYKSEVRMAANIFIRPSGEVDHVEIEESGLKGMPDCLSKAIGQWRFPAAEAQTATNLPLVFTPEVVKKPALQE